MKIFFRIAVVCFFAFSAAAKSPDEFIISMWCGPMPGGDYDAKYKEVADCNFTHASFACSGNSVEHNQAALVACQKYGLKCIVSDKRFWKAPKPGVSVTNNWDAAIADYAKYPALAGYFLGDEPQIGGFPPLAPVSRYLAEKDPAHFTWINLMPNYATDAQLGGTNYPGYVELFCETVKPPLLSYDHYALFEGQERGSYFENMEIIRRAGLLHDIPMAFIFLVTPHGTYRNPSETDLRWQVNTALAYGCKALFYFTYFTITDPAANFHNGIIDPQGHRTEHYEMAKRINVELKVLGPTLVKLTSTAVYHTGKLPSGCKELPGDAPIRVDGDASLIIGLLKHDDGSRWAIVVNRDLHKPVSAKLAFDEKIRRVKELRPADGKLASVRLRDHETVFEMPAAGLRVLNLGH